MLLRQFVNYCDTLNEQENSNICEEHGFNVFLTVPILHGVCAMLWVRKQLFNISINTLFIGTVWHCADVESREESNLQTSEIP